MVIYIFHIYSHMYSSSHVHWASFTGRGRRVWTQDSLVFWAGSLCCCLERSWWTCLWEWTVHSWTPWTWVGPRCWRDTPDWTRQPRRRLLLLIYHLRFLRKTRASVWVKTCLKPVTADVLQVLEDLTVFGVREDVAVVGVHLLPQWTVASSL